VKYQI